METQNETEYNGVQADLNGLEQELEKQRHDALKNSRFRVIEPGKTAKLTFTGVIYKRTAEGTDPKTNKPYKSDKLDFELTETVAEGKDMGKHKLFSVGARSSIVRDILQAIKDGMTTMLISRTGEGASTKYVRSDMEE